MFVKKTAGLGYLVTFFPAHSMFIDDKVDVVDNVLLTDGAGQYIMIMGKKKTHLLHVVADGALCILFGNKCIVQLRQAIQRRLRKGYFTVLIFFS
jgi:hypothetical protein